MRATKTSDPKPAPAAATLARPKLLTPEELCSFYPIKRRTLKYWLQHSADREVSCEGKRRTIPGNGLGPAIIRKGRLIFIDEDQFLAWLYGTTR